MRDTEDGDRRGEEEMLYRRGRKGGRRERKVEKGREIDGCWVRRERREVRGVMIADVYKAGEETKEDR